ncbi:UvrABC system protein [Trichinella pseudospiralis]
MKLQLYGISVLYAAIMISALQPRFYRNRLQKPISTTSKPLDECTSSSQIITTSMSTQGPDSNDKPEIIEYPGWSSGNAGIYIRLNKLGLQDIVRQFGKKLSQQTMKSKVDDIIMLPLLGFKGASAAFTAKWSYDSEISMSKPRSERLSGDFTAILDEFIQKLSFMLSRHTDGSIYASNMQCNFTSKKIKFSLFGRGSLINRLNKNIPRDAIMPHISAYLCRSNIAYVKKAFEQLKESYPVKLPFLSDPLYLNAALQKNPLVNKSFVDFSLQGAVEGNKSILAEQAYDNENFLHKATTACLLSNITYVYVDVSLIKPPVVNYHKNVAECHMQGEITRANSDEKCCTGFFNSTAKFTPKIQGNLTYAEISNTKSTLELLDENTLSQTDLDKLIRSINTAVQSRINMFLKRNMVPLPQSRRLIWHYNKPVMIERAMLISSRSNTLLL